MSATEPKLVVTLDKLLPAFGSVVPPGGVALAVLTMEPVAEAEIVPLTVNVTLAPAGSVAMAAETVLPLTPTDPGQIAPAVALEQVATMEPIALGTISLKLAPLAALGPSFLTVI